MWMLGKENIVLCSKFVFLCAYSINRSVVGFKIATYITSRNCIQKSHFHKLKIVNLFKMKNLNCTSTTHSMFPTLFQYKNLVSSIAGSAETNNLTLNLNVFQISGNSERIIWKIEREHIGKFHHCLILATSSDFKFLKIYFFWLFFACVFCSSTNRRKFRQQKYLRILQTNDFFSLFWI